MPATVKLPRNQTLVGILTCLELAAIFYVVAFLEHGLDLLLDGLLNIVNNTHQIAASRVTLHDESPLDVFAVDRVWALRGYHVGDRPQRDAGTIGCAD